MTILAGQIISQFIWTGTGTGTITAGAAVPDWLLPGSDLNGQTVGYHIRDPDTPGQVEVGQGVWNSGASTLTRVIVWANTLTGLRHPAAAAISYPSANAKVVTLVALPADFGALAGLSTVGTAEITDDAVTNAKLAPMATGTVKARSTAGTGDAEDRTVGTGLTLDGTSLRANPAAIDHDALQNFVADEHVPHASVSIATQHSLTGGGTIAANRTLSLVNDTAAPGNNKTYGTDGTGARGWKNDPTGSGSTLPVDDTTSVVRDPVDGGKQMRIDVGAVAPSTTRVLSMGDRDVNLAAGGTFPELSHTHSIDTAQLVDDAVTNLKLANMATATIKGRTAGSGTGDPVDLTALQAKTVLAITTSDVSGLGSLALLSSLDFRGLSDTPDSYTGAETNLVRVNAAGDALEFVPGSAGGVASFLGLDDTPNTYAGGANEFVKVNPGGTGLEFAPAPGSTGGLTNWVDVKQAPYSAVGNGSTNDATAIQNALNSGAAVVYIPAGTFRVNSALTVPPGVTVMGAGPGKTILDGTIASFGGGNGVLQCSGTTVNLPAVTSSITIGAASISYASSVAASLKHGDWIKVRDSTASSMDTGNGTDGFYAMVQSPEGSTCYLAAPALRTLPATRTAGPLANVLSTKLDQRGVCIRDLTIWGTGIDSTSADATGANGNGIRITLVANVYLDRVVVKGAGGSGYSIVDCANVHLTNCSSSVHTGTWNGFGQYGFNVQGVGYLYCTGCHFQSPRHGLSHSSINNAPCHNCTYNCCVIEATGTSLFMMPASGTSGAALDWHEGSFRTKCIGCEVHGHVVLRGQDQELIGCVIDNARSDGSNGTLGGLMTMTPNVRVIGCKIFCRSNGSSGVGMLFSYDTEAIDAGVPGSITISDNDIYVMLNSTQSLINIVHSGAKSPATGTIHITNNRVVHSACTTTQPFANITWTDGREVVVTNNVLPNNVTLGTIGTDFARRVLSPNTINGHVVFTGLPTASPGGTGRLWSSGGALQIT